MQIIGPDSRRTATRPSDPTGLAARFAHLDGADLLRPMINDVFRNRVAVLSSFGAESAVLLHMVAQISRSVPIVFLNTGKLFEETLEYRDGLSERLGLSDVRSVGPAARLVRAHDPDGRLWSHAPDACCDLRKVRPLHETLSGFEAVITGRKRFQAETRSDLEPVEWDGARYKINPLANWSAEDIETYMLVNELPPHPLVADGYRSIGCAPCTSPVGDGEDARAGRWRGVMKTECGIHGLGAAKAA